MSNITDQYRWKIFDILTEKLTLKKEKIFCKNFMIAISRVVTCGIVITNKAIKISVKSNTIGNNQTFKDFFIFINK